MHASATSTKIWDINDPLSTRIGPDMDVFTAHFYPGKIGGVGQVNRKIERPSAEVRVEVSLMLSRLAEALPAVGDRGVLGSSLICRHDLNSCPQTYQACKIAFLEPQDRGAASRPILVPPHARRSDLSAQNCRNSAPRFCHKPPGHATCQN